MMSVMVRAFAATTVLAGALVLFGCSNDDESADKDPIIDDPGPVHVHGLGTNPKDGALFIATHTGLFRLGRDETRATRVGGRYQDTMGFTVVGPDGFLGSGHPDGRDKAPPFLGLIRSGDAGQSWQPVSLRGQADFHVLEARPPRIYGFGSDWETRSMQLLVSDDDGKTWDKRETREPLVSLAINPRDPDRIFASGEHGLWESRDAGKRWVERAGAPGLLGWGRDGLTLVTPNGDVMRSAGGRRWRISGKVGGQPAAFEVEEDLHVALHDGTIKRSGDGGRTWTVRSRP
jgi:hypothetical protein